MTEQLEQTIKTRYVIQYRTRFMGCEYGIHRFWQDCKVAGCKQVERWTDWRDGAGYKPNEGGHYDFVFSATKHAEALKAVRAARRRAVQTAKRNYMPNDFEYRLVRQESIWTTVA